MKLRFTPKARAQAKEAEAWWRENRELAPDQFTLELSYALDRIIRHPHIYQQHIVAAKAVRRVQMGKTRYHVYFMLDNKADEAIILAVWGQQRGKPPPIS